MRNNRTFWRTFYSLAYPVTFCMAIFLMAKLAKVLVSPRSYDLGIACVVEINSSPFAISGGDGPYNVFASNDGGLTWREATLRLGQQPNCTQLQEDVWELPNPFVVGTQYRFRRGGGIDSSDDGGQSWTQEVDLSEIASEARRLYYELNVPPSQPFGEIPWVLSVLATPLDAMVDSDTGNVIVAMGHDGVLVRVEDGHWQWADVGPYSLHTFAKTELLQLLILNEFILAGILGLLSLTTIIQPIKTDERRLELFRLAVAWICWGSEIVVFLPAARQPLLNLASLGLEPVLITSAVLALGMALGDVNNVYEEKPTALPAMFTTAIVAALLFLLPYVLWTQGIIRHHTTATLFAFALVAATIYTGQQYMKRVFQGRPLMRKRKKIDNSSE